MRNRGVARQARLVTDALGIYSWAIEHSITRETHYCSDCCYDVIDGGHVVGTVNSEGIYHGPAPERQGLGYISRGATQRMISSGIQSGSW